MKNFEFLRPKSLQEASALLSSQAQSAIPYSGGTDALGLLKHYIVEPDAVVNLKSLPHMKQVGYSPRQGLRIGALVTIADIAGNPDIAEAYPILHEAAREIASPQLRNAGTLGGNLCQRPRCWYFRGDFHCLKKGGDRCYSFDGENQLHCIIGGGPCFIVHPSDMAVALLALDATISIYSDGQTRTVPVSDFYTLPANDPTVENILQPGDIVTEVQVPSLPRNTKSTYVKIKHRKVWDFALVSVGAVVQTSGRSIRSGRMAFGGVAPVPWQEDQVNQQLSGLQANEQAFTSLADSAFTDASPLENNGYKVPLVRNVIRQTLTDLTA